MPDLKKWLMLLLIAIPLLPASCKKESERAGEEVEVDQKMENSSGYYQEQYRPQFHFSPEEKWMNDPNGLVYNDGIYHLFYQYYPDDIVWGPMHWGHATSEDMIHWKHQPIALYPDELGYIFSGSAVVDHGNTSGLGKDGKDPLIAIFTYHDPVKAKAQTQDHETQGIAFSDDNGKTWSKYEGNPVIENPGNKDFRDPKVMWHEDSKRWIMSLAVGDHAEFFASENLKDWTYLSEFGKNSGAHGGVWECPDLIRMKVEGEEEEKWVLLISINPGGPNGGSATQYFVGDFDGREFKTKQRQTLWLDYGADNYAGVTYNNAPDAPPLFIGWMSNWNYALETPTKTWRSAMTLPRYLYLGKDESGYFVSSRVIPEFEKITELVNEKDEIVLDSTVTLQGSFEQAEVSWMQKISEPIQAKVSNDRGEYILFNIDPDNKKIELDRSKSGNTSFNSTFADKPHILPYFPSDKKTNVRLILDRASIEVFVDQGRYVMTEKFFPNEPFTAIELSSASKTALSQIKVKSISNTWKK